jgi:hypothetical protein
MSGGWARAGSGLLVLGLAVGGCSSADTASEDPTESTDATDATGSTLEDGETTTTAAVEPGQYGELSMLTYNVAGLPQEISTEQPGVNIPLISPLLEPFDLVMTQEDFDWWVDDLAGLDFVNYHTRLAADTTFEHATEQHPGPDAVGIDGEDPQRPLPLVGDGLGFLSRFPFTDVVRVPWDHCYGDAETGAGDCLAMKGFMVATFELAPGAEVDIYTLHGEAGEGPDDQPLQEEDYEQLAAFITRHSPGRAVMLAGDTNLHLEPGHDQEATDRPIWEGFLAANELADVCDTLECVEPGSIDKVAWRDGGGVTLEPLEYRWEDDLFVDPAGDDLSDHPPVAVDWRWTATD